jgi:hypothetical protein
MHKIRYVNKLFIVTFLFIFIMSVSSCFNIPTYKPVNIFDIGIPKAIKLAGIDLEIVDFLNDSETIQKMLYRVGKNRVEYDRYNKWSASPNRLLSNYLKAAFSTESDSSENIVLNLAGSINSFQIDLVNKQVMLSVIYRIRHKGNLVKQYKETIMTKFTQETPVSFAEAMSKNAEKLASLLKKQVEKIKNNIGNNNSNSKGVLVP